MQIDIRFFAAVRETLGTDREKLVVLPPIATIGALRRHLSQRDAIWGEVLTQPFLRMAMNQQMCDEDMPLEEGCEVAFFPPVTGG